MDGTGLGLHVQQRGGGGHGIYRVQRVAGAAVTEDVDLAGKVGVAHGQTDHEAVQLGLGQQLGTGGAHRVLGGDDHKGIGQRVGDAVHRDLTLLHDLQQRRLGLTGGAVDLVGQQQVGHHRAGLVGERAGIPAVQGKAHDVRGQYVGGELDTAVLQAQGAAEGQRRGGLAGAGHVVQQHMAAGEDRHEDLLQHVVLTYNDLPHLVQNVFYAGMHHRFSFTILCNSCRWIRRKRRRSRRRRRCPCPWPA